MLVFDSDSLGVPSVEWCFPSNCFSFGSTRHVASTSKFLIRQLFLQQWVKSLTSLISCIVRERVKDRMEKVGEASTDLKIRFRWSFDDVLPDEQKYRKNMHLWFPSSIRRCLNTSCLTLGQRQMSVTCPLVGLSWHYPDNEIDRCYILMLSTLCTVYFHDCNFGLILLHQESVSKQPWCHCQ